MTAPAVDPQQRHDQDEPPTHRECLEVLRRVFGADVEVLTVTSHTPAAAHRRQQPTPRRLFK